MTAPTSVPSVRIAFAPSGRGGDFESGTTVLNAARHLGVDLDSVCAGRMICGRCQIVDPGDGVEAATVAEHAARPARAVVAGQRLGCATRCVADVVVEVPQSSRIHHPVVRKAIDVGNFDIDPEFSLHYLEMAEPNLVETISTFDGLRSALLAQHDIGLAGATISVLPTLAAATKRGNATIALDRDQRLVAIWPGFVDQIVGVAIDVGSTTIAAYLCDLMSGDILGHAGTMNPQIRFGDDLMSRVSHVMMHPGSERELTAVVRDALVAVTSELLDAAGVDADRVLEVVVVGNPIMHHLVLGIDPTPLGTAPFTLATADAIVGRAADIGIDLVNAALYVPPCIAGHIGADAAAAMLAQRTFDSRAPQLLIDVGTNAEIVLGTPSGVFAASSPTGPAFEGGQLSCGQRAAPGAIERVRIDPETFVARYQVVGCDLWSDESGFADATRRTPISGICGSGIVEVIGEMFLRGLLDAQGVVRGEFANRTDRVWADGRTFRYVVVPAVGGRAEISVTQNDVRAIQLAKAALRAGVDLLMEHAGLDSVDDVRIAGAFGARIDPPYALLLGLVPESTITPVGNAAGAGAVRAMLSMTERTDIEAAVRRVVRIETATEPRFQELFVAAMAIPHGSTVAPPARSRRRRR